MKMVNLQSQIKMCKIDKVKFNNCLSRFQLFSIGLLLSLQIGSDAISFEQHFDYKIYNTAFEENFLRYPSPDVIINQLKDSFPLSIYLDYEVQECMSLTPNNRGVLGDNNPVTGKPLTESPNAGFVVWYTNCLSKLLYRERSSLSVAISSNSLEQVGLYFKPYVLEQCLKDKNLAGSLDQLPNCNWLDLSEEVRLNRVSEMIIDLIGPDGVLRDLGIAGSTEELAQIVLAEIEWYIENPDGRYNFMEVPNAGGSMSVLNALQISKFLILMTDMFKY